jgi:hypothetical protein
LPAGVLLLLATGCAADVTAAASPGGAVVTASAPSSSAAAPAVRSPRPLASASRPAAAPGTALAVLATLSVKGRAPRTGYDRQLFGQRWADTDRNGCDTRNDILRRDLGNLVLKPGTRGCVVLSGRLADPYTGRVVAFRRAEAEAVHVDHVVSLSDAWQKGAQGWAPGTRLAFANDPLNLLAVHGPTNASKSDGDAATWLPPNKAYRCPLVARQIGVKAVYGLWVTAAERDAMARVLGGCPGQRVPSGGSRTTAPDAAPPTTRAAAAPPPGQAREYANCTALRQDYPGGVARPGAVNVGGISRRTPHHDAALYEANRKSDRDKDGVACES